MRQTYPRNRTVRQTLIETNLKNTSRSAAYTHARLTNIICPHPHNTTRILCTHSLALFLSRNARRFDRVVFSSKTRTTK